MFAFQSFVGGNISCEGVLSFLKTEKTLTNPLLVPYLFANFRNSPYFLRLMEVSVERGAPSFPFHSRIEPPILLDQHIPALKILQSAGGWTIPKKYLLKCREEGVYNFLLPFLEEPFRFPEDMELVGSVAVQLMVEDNSPEKTSLVLRLFKDQPNIDQVFKDTTLLCRALMHDHHIAVALLQRGARLDTKIKGLTTLVRALFDADSFEGIFFQEDDVFDLILSLPQVSDFLGTENGIVSIIEFIKSRRPFRLGILLRKLPAFPVWSQKFRWFSHEGLGIDDAFGLNRAFQSAFPEKHWLTAEDYRDLWIQHEKTRHPTFYILLREISTYDLESVKASCPMRLQNALDKQWPVLGGVVITIPADPLSLNAPELRLPELLASRPYMTGLELVQLTRSIEAIQALYALCKMEDPARSTKRRKTESRHPKGLIAMIKMDFVRYNLGSFLAPNFALRCLMLAAINKKKMPKFETIVGKLGVIF